MAGCIGRIGPTFPLPALWLLFHGLTRQSNPNLSSHSSSSMLSCLLQPPRSPATPQHAMPWLVNSQAYLTYLTYLMQIVLPFWYHIFGPVKTKLAMQTPQVCCNLPAHEPLDAS